MEGEGGGRLNFFFACMVACFSSVASLQQTVAPTCLSIPPVDLIHHTY